MPAPQAPPGQVVRSARDRAGQGLGRVRAHAWSIAQCAVGSALAWEVAHRLLGHPAPFFAAVAAIVALGLSAAQRIRRVGELAVGVALGVGLGSLIVHEIGRGGWQLGLVVALGMGIAQALDGGNVITNQAALQAVFVAVLPAPPGGFVTRWEDALVGGLVALAVAAIAPPDPRRAVARRAADLVATLADVVDVAARAVRDGDATTSEAALDLARSTQPDVDAWLAALRAGEETSRLSPLRRASRPDLERYRAAMEGVDRAIRNVRVAVRRIDAELDAGRELPAELADILEDFAAALRALRLELSATPASALADGTSTAALIALSARLDPHALHAESLSATVVVAQMRSAVIDLLTAQGMSVERARGLMP
ncbi:MAG: FUSC family protein [Kineosporiaceae bacterium]